jgi:predicted lipoprotein
MLAKNIVTLLLVTLIPACALLGEQSTNARQPVYRSDIEPYLQEWEQSKQSIARLREMEQDLALLLQLVASQANVEALPPELRSDVERVTHNYKQQVQNTQAVHQVKIKLGTFLRKEQADAYLQDFRKRYPQLDSIISYQIDKHRTINMGYFVVIGGPFNSVDDARKVCLVLNQLSESCQLLSP